MSPPPSTQPPKPSPAEGFARRLAGLPLPQRPLERRARIEDSSGAGEPPASDAEPPTPSSLTARLQSLRPPTGAASSASQGPQTSRTATPPAASAGRLDALIPPRATPAGPLHLLEAASAGPWRGVSAPTLRALTLAKVALDARRPLFLDTETTGLAGGTGTLAFLVGVAHVDGGEVCIEQAHLAGPGKERPILEWLRSHLAKASLLVTFNGKSFDWPLLRSRFVMNRLPPPPEPPHVDLLHCARRVFRHATPQCTLGALEQVALDHHRQGDLGGALIPAVWFDYLRTGRVAMLGRVLQHNVRDVVSMVELLRLLADAWEERQTLPPAARLGLAQLAVRTGDVERALRWLNELGGLGRPLLGLALELKSSLLRRRGAHAEAAQALEAALPHSVEPARVRLALAKLYEHRLGDVVAARSHAVLARTAEPLARHEQRLRRLSVRGTKRGAALLVECVTPGGA